MHEGQSAPDPEQDTQEVRCAPPRGPWVVEIGSPEGGAALVLRPGDRVVLGSGKLADVRVADIRVSQRHCCLRAEADRVEIEDLGSKNGVYAGALRVARASVLADSGLFVIGRTSVVVRAGAPADGPRAEALPGLIGSSLAMQRVFAEVRRHAPTRAPVLLQGESGTGKDVTAQALHRLSRRAGAYVTLNVGALPESLADAELFGHRRGAFTGAVHSRPGAFEQAHGGSLFLDEIADLPLSIQVKLLRVVEDGCIRALGASSVTRVEVRVVSASWADLGERVLEGRFRADLLHRLAMVVIPIPALREHKSDLPELASALLRRLRGEVGEKELTSGALSRLLAHSWPGNVRELGSVLYRAAMLASGGEILAEHVESAGLVAPALRAAPLAERDVRALLEEHRGNVSRAARAAGVPRSTFRSWLARSRDTAA